MNLLPIESMASVLLFGEIELADERRCLMLLHRAGFDLGDILAGIDAARERAREMLANQADRLEPHREGC